MKEELNCHSSIVSLLYWLIRGGLTKLSYNDIIIKFLAENAEIFIFSFS